MTRHRVFLALLGAEALVCVALAGSAGLARRLHAPERAANRRLASALQLTDLSLWNEARYTRHPSQADFFSPFQDFPGSLEHFPSGSLLAPPATLGRPAP